MPANNEGYGEAARLDFLTGLRHVANHTPEGAYFITAITTFRSVTEQGQQGPRMQDGSQWYNHYALQLLRPFNGQDASQLLGHLSIYPP